ncbi:MAG: murein biosynthesis integral membrane protein MurJ [Patescibacteria group bacterium]
MWQKVWYKINNTVTGGAILIAFFSLLAKIVALFRERLIAATFGASQLSDIYYAAFRLPDFIFNTLVLGALTSAFIPIFQKVWLQDKKRGLNLANSVINFFLILIVVLVIIAFIWAAPIISWITPGFGPWELEQTIRLSRIMLLATIFFVVSNILGGILNSWKKFFSFSLAASFYNLGIIIGIIFFYPQVGLAGLAWGVVIGAAMHGLVQLPEAIKNGWRYNIILKWDSNLRQILKLMVPRTIGLAAGQINLVAVTMIGSTLTAGSIAIFNLANNLQSLPVSLFAVSLAVAVFPTFTQAFNENRQDLFAANFTASLRRILFLLIPLSVLLVVLRAQVVRVILGSGNFNWDNTYYTAQTLGWFSISIFSQGLIPLLARAFYAQADTKTPTSVGIICIIFNIFLSWALAVWANLGVIGLAIAFSITNILNMLILYIILHYRLSKINDNLIFISLLKISFNSLIGGMVAYGALNFMAPLVNMHTFLGIFTQGLVAGLLGLLSFLILSILFKLEEVQIVKDMLKRSLAVFKNGSGR